MRHRSRIRRIAVYRPLLSSVVVFTIVAGSSGPAAQQPVSPPNRFDVVSVKETNDRVPVPMQWTPGRFAARSALLLGLINMAYGGGTPLRLDGAAPLVSLRTTMWDIDATFEPAVTPSAEQRAAMLRALLEDRFRLVLRSERRDTDVSALVLSRRDGLLGPSLQQATVPCDAPGRPAFSANLPAPGQRPSCGIMNSIPASAILGGKVPLENLTRVLSGLLQRTVIDRTGLTGEFDIVLVYAPDATMGRPVAPAGFDLPPPPDGAPSLVTALQEQLGLKLESTRTPLEYHVIERLETPTPN